MTASLSDEVLNPLSEQLGGLLPRGVVGAIRLISHHDEDLLRPGERVGLERSVAKVRQASGAARSLARDLCARLGHPVEEIPRGGNGVPQWPRGILGSIAHDATFAAVVATDCKEYHGIGIDIEPDEPLADDLLAMVATEQERQYLQEERGSVKVLFSIKEAVFKAVNPHDGIFLEFHDVVVDFLTGTADVNYGRKLSWRVITQPHIVAIAWW